MENGVWNKYFISKYDPDSVNLFNKTVIDYLAVNMELIDPQNHILTSFSPQSNFLFNKYPYWPPRKSITV